MPKLPKLPKKITSAFALIEIQMGRKQIAGFVGSSHRIPVTIHGYLMPGTSNVGNDDGVGIEFGTNVESISIGTPEFVALDTVGRPYAMGNDVKAGDRLQCDGSFTCMKEGTRKTVKADKTAISGGQLSHLYIPCKDGRHYLDGQEGDHGELIGLYKV